LKDSEYKNTTKNYSESSFLIGSLIQDFMVTVIFTAVEQIRHLEVTSANSGDL
jgi:hypothetical protein